MGLYLNPERSDFRKTLKYRCTNSASLEVSKTDADVREALLHAVSVVDMSLKMLSPNPTPGLLTHGYLFKQLFRYIFEGILQM